MKTVNLELARKLKEAGYPQDMDWIYSWYCSEPDCEEREVQTRDDNYCESCGLVVEGILSPTADEILEQLPAQIKEEIQEPWLVCTKNKALEWEVGYATNNGFEDGHMRDEELANACAKLWLYLKQNNLLSQKEERK